MRNLKAFGLVVVAVLAFGAMTAASASAQKLTSDGPVTLIGTQTGPTGSNALTSYGGKVECPEAKYTGHQFNVTPHVAVPSGASTLTITPHYGICFTYPGDGSSLSTTVDMNGCDYVFHLEAKTAASTYPVKATVVCPVGAHIQVTAFSSSSHAFRLCTVTIKHNATGYSGLHATDTGNGHVDISGTAAGIESTRSGIGCTGEEKTGALHIDATIEGKSGAKTTAISLSD